MSDIQLAKENTTENLNLKNYELHKHVVKTLIENEMKTILLIGTGKNGKSYLLNEIKDMITSNGYNTLNYYPIPAFFSKSKFFDHLYAIRPI